LSYNKYKTNWLNSYPAISDLAKKAKSNIPNVAWQYLETGTGREALLKKNITAFNNITFTPRFCKGQINPNLKTTILNQTFNAPFGIAPVGLTGLIWPKAEIFLAQTAKQYQIPYTLSTVATETPETLSNHIDNIGWFQLYPPYDGNIRKNLLERAQHAGFRTLLITADVPAPSLRERTKRAGLTMPPKITPNFIWQGITHPTWSIKTLKRGLPSLRTVAPYAPSKSMKYVSKFMNQKWRGDLTWEYCKAVRDEWKGPILMKGILHPKDVEKVIEIGLDGIVVSNHGGRQFDAAPPAIDVLPQIAKAFKNKLTIVFDSGIRSGLDVMRALALGADFVLLGRAFIYGVAALGKYGGHHVAQLLIEDLKNNMAQIGVKDIAELKKYIDQSSGT